jgi:tetratricopeptide (TPR) repeat protein
MIKNLLIKIEFVARFLLIVAVFCLIFILAHRSLFDLDIWLHLKTGEYIVQNKIIPAKDLFSFVFQGKPWLNHSWIFQVLTYLVYNKWGADGLIFLESLLIALSFFILFLIGHAVTRSYLELGMLLVVTAFASLTRFNIRPDLFSVLFFSLYLYILSLYIDRKTIWLLVPVQILWVNFHGYFFLGPLLVLFFILAEFLNRKLKFLTQARKEGLVLSQEDYRRLKRLFLSAALVCFINPNGLKGAMYPLFVTGEVASGRAKIFLQYIQELQPTFTSLSPSGSIDKFYYMTIVFCLGLMAINFRRVAIIEIILFVFFFLFSLSLRNIVFFLFICYVIILTNLEPLLEKVSLKVEMLEPLKQRLYLLFRCVATILFIVWLGLRIDRVLGQSYYDFEHKELKSLLMGTNESFYPKKAVDFILENDIPGNMFNDFNSGAYLIGRSYPKRKVFIDGRTEFYGPDFFKEYMDAIKRDVSSFESIVHKYNITSVLMSMAVSSMPDLVGYIYRNPEWQLIYLDESAVIFLKDIPENRELIKKHKIDLNKYTVPKVDLKELRLRSVYPSPYIKRASVFDLFHEDELVMSECKEALRIMPNCAQGFYFIGKAYMRQGSYQEALENLRSSLLFTPNSVEALMNLGICYQELKDPKIAIDALKKAIRINKTYAPAYYRLGYIHLLEGNESKAIEFLKKAIKYEPQDPAYHFKLAGALFEKGKKSQDPMYLKQVESSLKQALELNRKVKDKELSKQIEDLIKRTQK